jgi:hypothetical protein
MAKRLNQPKQNSACSGNMEGETIVLPQANRASDRPDLRIEKMVLKTDRVGVPTQFRDLGIHGFVELLCNASDKSKIQLLHWPDARPLYAMVC